MRRQIHPWSVENVERANFLGQDIPYDAYCNVTTVLKVDSVYKLTSNQIIIPRYMLKNVNTSI